MTSIYDAAFEQGRALGKCHAEAADYANAVASRSVCEYSAKHKMQGERAVVVLDCGPVVGKVNACQKCADFYESMQ